MAGKGFYDAFNPEAIIPLALKKYDIDLAKRKLDMIERDHNFQVEQARQATERDNMLREKLLTIASDRDIAELPKVEGGEGESGLFPVPKELSGFGNQMIDQKVLQAGDSKATLRKIMPYVKDPMKAFEMLMKSEERPRRYGEAEILAGMGPAGSAEALENAKRRIAEKPETATNSLAGLTPSQKLRKEKADIIASGSMGPAEESQIAQIDKELAKITGEEGRVDNSHNVIEIPAPDGKTAQKFQYNPNTKSYDIALGKPYAVRSQVQNINSPAAQGEVETTAQLLAEGKINSSDVSKRGGPGVVDKIFKRAREINPDFDPRGLQAENAGYQATISMQEKQIGQMGSFVKNMAKQVDRVKEISKELQTFDTRLLNIPLRAVRGRVAGSANQAKYDMYITEIESEIGKLATGSSASISELSISAQEKWARIHDKNLSIKDMLSLLKETQHAGEMRMESVMEQLDETKTRRKGRGKVSSVPSGGITVDPSKIKRGW